MDRRPSHRLTLAAIALFGLPGLVACGPKYPNCKTDDDCHGTEVCIDQQCQQCETDAQCGDGEACVDYACEPAPVEAASMPAPQPPKPTASVEACDVARVQFGFDSAQLAREARERILENVRCLKERGASSVQLTGHTDDLGTEEYNLALGDRRASSVKEYMQALGMEATKISSTSRGEEDASGIDEPGRQGDRKVEFRTE